MTFQIFLKRRQPRRDWIRSLKAAGKRVGRLQSVAGDAQDRGFVGLDASLRKELTRCGYRYASGSLSEYTFGFSQQSHRIYDFRVGRILAPATAGDDGLDRVKAVGRIADGQRTRNGGRLLRLDLAAAAFYRSADGTAARSLRTE